MKSVDIIKREKTELENKIYEDIQSEIRKYYDSEEIGYKDKEEPKDTIIDFFAYLYRLIPVIKRKVHYSEEYDDAIDQVVNQHLLNIKKLQRNCADQIISLKNALKEEIKVRIQFYRRDEFFAVLFSIKEYIRRYLLRCKRPQWNYINDVEQNRL